MQKVDVEDLPMGGKGRNFSTENDQKSASASTLEREIASMSVVDLLQIRALVDAKLPMKHLKDIDLSSELVIQVLALQQAQQKALADENTPTNQLSQAMSALTSALSTLVKLQADTYTSERLKKIETILIETLSELPQDLQLKFIEAYEAALEQVV